MAFGVLNMRQLRNKEIEQVNGGLFAAFAAGYFFGTIAVKLYKKYA